MRKQIAAANWKMNLTYQQAEKLLDGILGADITLKAEQRVIFAVPFPYLLMTRSEVEEELYYETAAQNCYEKTAGAFTGEISAEMLHSIGIHYCIIGHSERRMYFGDSNAVLVEKINRCYENFIIPIFCCGESLNTREEDKQNDLVSTQLRESLFHLPAEKIKDIIIAYEPVWAIGTGKTATTAQAQEMHRHIRSILAGQYGTGIAEEIPILYGGSIKAGNARELFNCPDVDGGLVGGASLVVEEFIEIIKALK